MRSIIGTIVYSWVGEHVWVTQRMRENVIHPCLGLVAFLWSGKGAGPFLFTYAVEVWKDSSMALSSPGLIWSSCLQTVQSPTWTLMVIGTSSFASDFSPRWALEGDFQMQSITYGQSTPIPIKPHRNLYVLHFKHQGNRYPCRSLGGFEVMEHLRSSHHCNCCLDTREWTQTRG